MRYFKIGTNTQIPELETYQDYDEVTLRAIGVERREVQTVSARQFMLAAYNQGLYDSIIAFVDAQPLDTQLSFDFTTEFDKSNPYLQAGFTALQKTPEEVTAFFEYASTL